MIEVFTREQAQAKGLLWYFTGEPCRHGHLSKRSVSNRECRACVDARERRKRAENPEPFRAREKRRYDANHERRLAQSKARRDANPERTREWKRRDYEKNYPKIAARVRAWQRKNPGRLNHWVQMRRQRIRRATPPWLTVEQKREIRAFYVDAAAREGDWEVDHIVPLKGRNVCGLHVPWNLRVVPALVNRRKSNRHEP